MAVQACQLRCRIVAKIFGLLALSFAFTGCVPKASYEDKVAELERLQAERRSAEWAGGEMSPQAFSALQEQVQSLDILSQELIDRNTELSEEVARLRRQELERKQEKLNCDLRLKEQSSRFEAQLERTRSTYEDMVEDLRKQLKR